MGKIRTRVVGLEDVEEQQKKEQKERAAAKKALKGETVEATPVESEKDKKAEKKQKKASSKAMTELKAVEEKEKIETTGTEKDADAPEAIVRPQDRAKKVRAKKKGQPGRGKKYKQSKKMVDEKKLYVLTEAVTILKKAKYADFDEAVELHLNVIETGLKGEIDLPHSTGKTVKVAIVDDAVIEKLENNIIDFDILITHPSFMPKLAKFARVLGPKGLMPNPKAGTVSTNPQEVSKKFEKGLLKWKTEPKFPLIHQMVGKISHDEKAIAENAQAFLNAVGTGKVKAAYIKTTMGPSLKIALQ